MAFLLNGGMLTLFLARHCPRLFGYTERDMELMCPVKEKIFYHSMRESGYMHIQSTKPDTVGERVLGLRSAGGGGVGMFWDWPRRGGCGGGMCWGCAVTAGEGCVLGLPWPQQGSHHPARCPTLEGGLTPPALAL